MDLSFRLDSNISITIVSYVDVWTSTIGMDLIQMLDVEPTKLKTSSFFRYAKQFRIYIYKKKTHMRITICSNSLNRIDLCVSSNDTYSPNSQYDSIRLGVLRYDQNVFVTRTDV